MNQTPELRHLLNQGPMMYNRTITETNAAYNSAGYNSANGEYENISDGNGKLASYNDQIKQLQYKSSQMNDVQQQLQNLERLRDEQQARNLQAETERLRRAASTSFEKKSVAHFDLSDTGNTIATRPDILAESVGKTISQVQTSQFKEATARTGPYELITITLTTMAFSEFDSCRATLPFFNFNYISSRLKHLEYHCMYKRSPNEGTFELMLESNVHAKETFFLNVDLPDFWIRYEKILKVIFLNRIVIKQSTK